jgi:hypothetical protein
VLNPKLKTLEKMIENATNNQLLTTQSTVLNNPSSFPSPARRLSRRPLSNEVIVFCLPKSLILALSGQFVADPRSHRKIIRNLKNLKKCDLRHPRLQFG